MEFTYEGLVRYGFGFYNPNHAAAFICAILPFAWIALFQRACWQKILGGLISVILILALAFTYSRAGVLVFILEALAFAFYFGKKYWKVYCAIGVVLIFSLLISSAMGRFTFDAAASNRIDIWLAGLKLFLGNPLGIGLGNSGEIASAFLLPEDIEIRSLVNSHLTLLCEFGFIVGALWISLIFYTIKSGYSQMANPLKFAALVSFCSLVVSSGISSAFDWEVLLNPSKFEYITNVNLAALYCLFALFSLLAFYLIKGSFRLKEFFSVFALFVGVFLPFFVLSRGSVILPAVRKHHGDVFVRNCKEPPYSVVIFDDDYNLKSAMAILRELGLSERIYICKNSWQNREKLPRENPKSFILFGNCSDFLNENIVAPCVLIMPPPHFTTDARNISKIYIPKWNNRYDKLRKNFPKEKITDF